MGEVEVKVADAETESNAWGLLVVRSCSRFHQGSVPYRAVHRDNF